MADKSFQSVVEMLDVFSAFRQQDGRAAFFHGHEHIIDNLLVTSVIGYQHSIEFLDG
ncbi:MAG TPA: hypothetical protein VGA68_04620 [Woeseiaceae bacterium]